MLIHRAERHHMIRLIRGEEILQTVHDYARQEEIEHAVVLGIGAVMDVEIGAYSIEDKEYTRRGLVGPLEVVNLTGNLAWVDGSPYLHAHVTLSDHDCAAVAGHLFKATCYATVELTVWPGEGRIERTMDDQIGLKLWDLPVYPA